MEQTENHDTIFFYHEGDGSTSSIGGYAEAWADVVLECASMWEFLHALAEAH